MGKIMAVVQKMFEKNIWALMIKITDEKEVNNEWEMVRKN